MSDTITPEELEELVNAPPAEQVKKIKAVPITIFTVVGKRFHVPDFNAWGYLKDGRFVFADGFFLDDDGEQASERQDIMFPGSSILWLQPHFDAVLSNDDDVIKGTELDETTTEKE